MTDRQTCVVLSYDPKIFDLQFKAQLDNVTDLIASGDDFRWYFKVRCGNCGEENDKWIYCTIPEKFEVPGGKGEANIVIKCALCNRLNNIEIVDRSLKAYTAEHSETFSTILSLDCRGVEPFSFSPRVGFVCKGANSTTIFEDVDLTENEWTEYDDKANESVSIMEVESQFIKAGQDNKGKRRN